MIILYVLLILLLLLILYVLFAPFFIEINTENKLYRFRFHRVFAFSVNFLNDTFMGELNVLGVRKKMDLLKHRPVKKNDNNDQIAGSRHKKKSTDFHLKKIVAIIKTFEIKSCSISVDTGDNYLNGILFPWFYMLSLYTGKTFRINFKDENRVELTVKNNLAAIVWAYIKT